MDKDALYQPGKAVIASDTNRDYRQDSIVDCDKAGRRPSGRAKARRTQTSKAVNGQSCCPFKFVIGWDEKGYYLIQTAGNHKHVGHPKTDPEKTSIATRLLSKEEHAALHHQAVACAGAGVGRNYIYSKLGKYINRATIAYIQSKEVSFTTPIKGKGSSSLPINDVEQLIDFLKKERKFLVRSFGMCQFRRRFSFIPERVLLAIKVVLVDGDPQQRGELE
jgi:hypothetical protein